MFALLASLAFADTITIDTGASIDADLARYEADGDCQLSVTEGDLQGVIVILPCSRIVAFQRAERPKPIVYGAVMPLDMPVDMPVNGAVTEEVTEVEPSGAAEAPGVRAPALPDSIAALKADDFVTPFPVADQEYEAEALERDEEAEEGEASEPAPGALPGRAAPTMPVAGKKPLSF